MASCGEIKLLLGPFDDGELEPHEMEEVAFHVVQCVECKAALDDYRALGVAMRRVITVPALDGFAQAVQARIERAPAPLRQRVGRWWGALGMWASVAQVAGLTAATAVLTLWIAPHVPGWPVFNARSVVAESVEPQQIARLAPHLPAAQAPLPTRNPAAELARDETAADIGAQELLSELGSGNSPSVAVWNVPRTDTTVVWVPDQR